MPPCCGIPLIFQEKNMRIDYILLLLFQKEKMNQQESSILGHVIA